MKISKVPPCQNYSKLSSRLQTGASEVTAVTGNVSLFRRRGCCLLAAFYDQKNWLLHSDHHHHLPS